MSRADKLVTLTRTEGKPLPTFDCYYSEVDGTLVVHIDTEDIPNNQDGPMLRIYLNDGDPIWANPDLPCCGEFGHDEKCSNDQTP